MIDPMFKRLAGCLLFGALFSGALMTFAADRTQAQTDAKVAAALEQRMTFAAYTRR